MSDTAIVRKLRMLFVGLFGLFILTIALAQTIA